MTSDNNRENIINMHKRTKRLDRKNITGKKAEKWKLRTMFYDGVGISEMAVMQQIEGKM